jgi:hypothetical protein
MSDDVETQLVAALRREAAVAGVLRAVADAGADLEAVLVEIARQAAALTEADNSSVFRRDGDVVRLFRAAGPIIERAPDETSVLNQVLRDRVTTTLDDQSALTDPAQTSMVDAANTLGFKSSAYVPLPAGGPAVGISVTKSVVDPFTEGEVELVRMFAARS